MSERLIIRLNDEHIAFSDDVGKRRNDDCFDRGVPPGNGAPFERGAALRLNVIGARCECAGYLWLKPIKWNYFVRNMSVKQPDLGDFIDVKGRGDTGEDLFLHHDDPTGWAYLQVSARHHPDYEILGWAWGWQVKHKANRKPHLERPGEGPLFLFEAKALRPYEELYAMVRQIEAAAA